MLPKVNRVEPIMGSIPTRLNIIPSNALMSPFIKLFEVSEPTVVRPNRARRK